MPTGGDTIRVLIAGGGVAALEAALTLRDLAGDLVSVQLIAPEDRFSYRPLAVAEPFGLAEARQFPMEELAAAAGATFTAGTLLGVDVTRKRASTTAGARDYDALLVASGAEPYAAVPGALTFRGPADTDEVTRLLAQVDAGELRRVAFVIPPGAVWTLPAYELALLTARHVVAGPGRDVEW